MRVEIVVFPGVDELDAVGPLEVLRRAAAETPEWEVRLVTAAAGNGRVRGAYGLTFETDGVLDPAADLVVVPGGGWNSRSEAGAYREAQRGELPSLLAAAAGAGAVIASVCTGALLVAEAGLLSGRRATTHHGARDDLAAFGAFVVEDRVVDDGDRLSAGGVSSGIDLALWLVERFAGDGLAERIAGEIEYRWSRPGAEGR